ncbi:MAG: L,D-transpeptidase family protein, partial [Candidatus Jordarchaeaceae archaeon]
SLVYFSPSGSYSHHRIITGSAVGKNRTPLMTSFVTAIQVNPWWYPTPRIAKESPKYRKPIPPGPSNPLGTVKLITDSPFTVFLHDTPHQHLFDREIRAYSHGCIRTEDAEILAGLILEDDNQNINIDELIESGKTKTIYLKEHVPLIISYLRSFIEPDGTVSEGVDVYRIGFRKIYFTFRKW